MEPIQNDDGRIEGKITEGVWSNRMTKIREVIEAMGSGLKGDQDWIPTAIIDANKTPETMPDGGKTPPDKINKPCRLIFGFPSSEFFATEEAKDYFAMLLGLTALKCMATQIAYFQVVWMLELNVGKKENESLEDFEVRARQAMKDAKAGNKSLADHPDRKERLVLLSVAIEGEDDGQKVAYADVIRKENESPRLENWTIAEAGEDSSFAGRFFESLTSSLHFSSLLLAREAKKVMEEGQ
jgi:hypothetical protein